MGSTFLDFFILNLGMALVYRKKGLEGTRTIDLFDLTPK